MIIAQPLPRMSLAFPKGFPFERVAGVGFARIGVIDFLVENSLPVTAFDHVGCLTKGNSFDARGPYQRISILVRFPYSVSAPSILTLCLLFPATTQAASIANAWVDVKMTTIAVSEPIFIPINGEFFQGPAENISETIQGSGEGEGTFAGFVQSDPPLTPEFSIESTAMIQNRSIPQKDSVIGFVADVAWIGSSSFFRMAFNNGTSNDVTILTAFEYNLGISASFDEKANFDDPSVLFGEYTNARATVSASFQFFGERGNETIFSETLNLGENEQGELSLLERGSFETVERFTTIAPGESGFFSFNGLTSAITFTGLPVQQVPLPASLPLAMIGLGGLAILKRKSRQG